MLNVFFYNSLKSGKNLPKFLIFLLFDEMKNIKIIKYNF